METPFASDISPNHLTAVNSLPNEILIQILEQMPVDSKVELVCRHWHELMEQIYHHLLNQASTCPWFNRLILNIWTDSKVFSNSYLQKVKIIERYILKQKVGTLKINLTNEDMIINQLFKNLIVLTENFYKQKCEKVLTDQGFIDLRRLVSNRKETKQFHTRPTQVQLNHLSLLTLPNSVVQRITTLVNISEMDLSHNKLVSLPPSFSKLRIKVLNLSNNNFYDVPSELLKLPLIHLNLSNNFLTDLPSEITEMEHLQVLDVHNNQLINLSFALDHPNFLTVLDLSKNRLTQFPENIQTLTNLKELHLQCNQLTEIPVHIQHLTLLKHLDLFSNCLKTLPKELASLSNLTYFSIGENLIQSLPKEIEKAKNPIISSNFIVRAVNRLSLEKMMNKILKFSKN